MHGGVGGGKGCGFKAAENRKFIGCGPEQADALGCGCRHTALVMYLQNLWQKSTQSSHKFKSHCRISLRFVVDSTFLFLIKRQAVSLRSAMCHQNPQEWSWRKPSNLQLCSFKGRALFLHEFWCWSRVSTHMRTCAHTRTHTDRSHGWNKGWKMLFGCDWGDKTEDDGEFEEV